MLELRDLADPVVGDGDVLVRVRAAGCGPDVWHLMTGLPYFVRAMPEFQCSGSKADLVRSLGADDVIDYTRENFADGRRRWDVIVDTAGRRPVRLLRRALTSRGTLAIVGGDGGGKVTGGFFRQILRAPLLSVFTRQRLRPVMAKEKLEDLRTLAEMVDAGQFTPVVGKTFPLAEAADAVRELERGHTQGKLVVTVQGDEWCSRLCLHS